jgi:alkaline phosphatase
MEQIIISAKFKGCFLLKYFKLILFIVVILLMVSNAAYACKAAIYFVDNVNGDDLNNDGSLSNPWASIRKAMKEVTAGDTVNIINNGPDNPYREEAPISPISQGTPHNKITIQGPGQSQYAYIVMSSNYSEGAPCRECLIFNKDMEYWSDASTPTDWDLYGFDYTVLKDSSEVYSGEYSLKAVIGTEIGSEFNMHQILKLIGSSNVTFSFYYKASHNFSFLVQNIESGEFWHANSSQWSTGGYFNTVLSSTEWNRYSITFPLNGSSRYRFWINAASDNSITYVDQIRITEQTNSWEPHHNSNNNTYKIYVSEPFTIFGALKSEWNSKGVNAVSKRDRGAEGYNALLKGEWDWSNDYLYYRLNDNETIDTVHLEGNYSNDKVVQNFRNHIIFRYLDVSLGYEGFVDSYSTSVRYEYCRAHHIGKIGFSAWNNATPIYEYCEASYAATEDGFHATNGAHITCNYCVSHDNWDDGFQVHNAAITANYSISYQNGLEGLDGHGFSLHPGFLNKGIFNNCISYKNDGNGFELSGNEGSTATVKNSISYENDGDQFITDGILTLTADYNCAENFTDPNWPAHEHDIIADPLFSDPANFDFTLQFTSPLIDAGVDVNLDTDFNGNQPYDHPDIVNYGSSGSFSKPYVDIGAFEYGDTCIDTGSISISEGHTLSGPIINLTSLVSAVNATDLLYTVKQGAGCPAQTNESIIAKQDTWKYNAANAGNIGTSWMNTGFDDTGWSSGSGIFGYGDAYVDTTVGVAQDQWSMYFRKTFTICDANAVTSLIFNATYDDGMVVYINGTPVIIAGVSGNPPAWNGGATSHESNQTYQTFDLDAYIDSLVTGINVIAVGTYNRSITSSDLIFDGELIIDHNTADTILFTGSHPEATNIDTAGWIPGVKDLEVTGNNDSCLNPLPPATGQFIFDSICRSVYYRDADGDGFGDPNRSIQTCSQQEGYVLNSTDCDDTNQSINPYTNWYQDSDGDGYGNPTVVLQQCMPPTGQPDYVLNNSDFNDNNSEIYPSGPPFNIIFILGDGMGFEQVKAASIYKNGAEGTLAFEAFPNQAEMTTYSANSAVTDSAAAATAIATGIKVNNQVISMNIPGDSSELYTLLEYFKDKGKSTGLVTTTYMTHPTPAAFGAHETSRYNTNEIAVDYLQQSIPNALFGGGGYGMTEANAISAGYLVVNDFQGMQSIDTESVTMVSGQYGIGLFPYEYDYFIGIDNRYDTLPHLSEMTATALNILDNDPDGLFLMVEGGLIDYAGHGNSIERNILETLEFENAVQEVINWSQGRSDTLILVTADHETGGLTVLQNNGPGVFPGVSWSSGGHTGINVPVYAWGVNSDWIYGIMDNTDLFAIATCPNFSQVRIDRGTYVYFTTLQEAYDEALDGEIIHIQDMVFTEDLDVNRNISIIFLGGYSCDFSSIIGKTVINGNVIVNEGLVLMENIDLQ